ncbi:asparagine synthase [Humibacillus sp. DSM 29435]|uniref:asparagine synthetase B family protein n=1 Tax=Humibacillus sp. DSM 29435 TaxID=1869167 RepID=UPI000871EBE8|nr:asparagine synthetase B [Humibacillus sp. DSM 29435]OFE14771.1 asparagine synthase [Humibacillus sp. DSM 29435]
MCGIAGFHGITADEGLTERLGRCSCHPAVDATAFAQGSSGLTGVSAGRVAERFEIVLDGEVYNRVVLRSQLAQLGHEFTTGDDWEVALAAFIEWGAEGFDRLNGPFAVAVRDCETSSITLARDHFGIRSLYLAASGRGWLFASSITPILHSGHHDRRPNDRIIYRYLRFGVNDDGRETFFDGIERVGAGEAVTITDAGVHRRPFTALRSELSHATSQPRDYDASVVREFRSRLTEAVRVRLRAPGPVAIALSGGIDSAAITAVVDTLATTGDSGNSVTKAVGAQLNTFSALFPESLNDEAEHIDAVTSSLAFGVAPHSVSPTPTEFKNDLTDFVRTQEEPLDSTGPYTQYRVLREAAEAGATAVLEGLGGDETLAGDGAHHLVNLRELRQTSSLAAVTQLARSADVLARGGRSRLGDRLRGRKAVPVTQLLDQQFVARHRHEAVSAPLTDLRERLLDDIFVGSLPARLRYDDRNARRFAVTTRMPLLDKDLVRFDFGLGSEALLKDGVSKRVLRDAVRDLLPSSVVGRRVKVGLTTPHAEWLLRLKNHIYGVFLSEPFANRPYFDQSEVLHTFEGWIKGGSPADSLTIWRLLNLELWLQEFFDEPADAAPAPEHVKSDYEANARKQLDLTLGDGTVVRRYPLRTELFSREDDLQARTLAQVARFFDGLPTAGPEHAAATSGSWHLFISEKIVAITQGRSYFIWDIKVGRPARLLSKHVTRTPAGIGLGSPFTMQLAIQEAGLPRVLYAAVGGGVARAFGRRGAFYELVGGDIRAIDGPTEYSVYPANVSAKLAPKDPDAVAAALSAGIRALVPEPYRSTYAGTVVMDANDLGRNALGQDAAGPKSRYEAMFADNPLGQGSEQTPMALVFVQPPV